VIHRSRAWALCALALLLLAAAALRLDSLRFDYTHPDEVIAVEVARSMLERGSLDTNWKLAPLPDVFRVPQYNFSAYLMAAAGAVGLQAWLPGAQAVDTLHWLRGFSALLGVAVVALTFLAGRRMFDAATGAGAAALVAVNPLLYQDSLYARPETFVTVLALLCIVLLAGRKPPGRGAGWAAAFLLGVLVATKVSMLLLLPILVLAMDTDEAGAADVSTPGWRAQAAAAWRAGTPMLVALVLGFAAGAPHALTNFADAIEGVMALQRQYTSGHWPHGVPDGTFAERLAHSGGYFRATTGWLFLVAFLGGAAAAIRRERRQLAVFLLAVATGLQFAAYPTFFERNLSHVVPVFAIFAAYAVVSAARIVIRRPRMRLALATAGLAWLIVPSVQTSWLLRFDALPGRSASELLAWRAQVPPASDARSIYTSWVRDVAEVQGHFGYWCGPVRIEIPTTEDEDSLRAVADLKARDGFREVARVVSPFSGIPASTLHTYFTPTTVILTRTADAQRCKEAGGGLVSRGMVGEPLRVVSLQADGGWQAAGAHGNPPDPFGRHDYRGSWAGSDATTGRLLWTIAVDGVDHIVLPYVTGPTPGRQSVVVKDAETGKVLLEGKLPLSRDWRFPMVRRPPQTRRILIEAVDAGTGWGEWHALGVPRALKED
jgi:hypothetical protein